MVLTKMNKKFEKNFRKKMINEDVEKQKLKLALLVGHYR